jgi:tRNA(Ile)-lysidine synthase TilS/MesJ
MRTEQTVAGVHLHRPLLGVPPERLRQYLVNLNQPWREDASNIEPKQRRNRLRPAAARHRATLLTVGEACAAWSAALDAEAPVLPQAFAAADVNRLPAALARRALRQWLIARGVPPESAKPAVIARVLTCCRGQTDVVPLPGNLTLRRAGTRVSAESS